MSGAITRAIEISSWPAKEFMAIARANGELRARVVIVRLAYSGYVKLIFSHINKSIMALVAKKIASGINIFTRASRFLNSKSPCDANMQNTARAKKYV